MEKILQSYQKRLTNLSSNNRSLLLLRLVSDQFIDLHNLDYALNDPSYKIIHQFIAGKSSIRICSNIDPRDKDSNNVSQRLKRLQRMDNFIFEERGSKDLYIGWPFVKGKMLDGTPIRGPLLFFPVELELIENFWYLIIRKDVNLTFNKSFLLAYSYYNGVKLSEEFIEKVFDDFDRNAKEFKTGLYQFLKESPVEINFNTEMFSDPLTPYESIKKSDLDEQEQNGELKLFPQAVLGIFPQSGSYLVPDYNFLSSKKEYESLENFFFERSFSEEDEGEIRHLSFSYFLNKLKEEQIYTPFKLDAFQENALKAVRKGNSIVVQGPPGTGKSQLICNLMSDFMARGKRVLLVCQKRAALDVVYDRLQQEELADFAALVHDFKNDRKDIYKQIHAQIEKLYEYKLKNNSLDSIQLERKYLQSSRQIDNLSEDLDEMKYALFDESESGVPIKELYLSSDISKPGINLKQEYNFFKIPDIDEFLGKLKFYLIYAKRFLKDGYPWRVRKNFKDHKISDLKKILEIISDIPKFQAEIDKNVKEVVKTGISLAEGDAISRRSQDIEQMFKLLKDEKTYKYFIHINNSGPKEADDLYLKNIEKNLNICWEGAGVEKSLPVSVLGKFQSALHNMFEARRNIFKWVQWIFFSHDRPMIQKALDNNKLTRKRKDLKLLTERLDNRLNLEHNLTKLRGNVWLKEVPEKPDKDLIEEWFKKSHDAIAAKDIFISVRSFSDYFSVSHLSYEQFKSAVNKLLEIIKGIPTKWLEWEIYLQPTKIQEILSNKYDPERLIQVLNRDFESLCDFDQLKDGFLDYELSIISKMEEIIDDYSEDELLDIFVNSLKLAWIEHIEIKYPILRSVSSLKFDPQVKMLQNAVKDKLRISKEIVLMRSRERTYADVTYNRLNNMITYRDLIHQVTKKRKIWPIRRLISHFSRELFNLIPCWLTSPESASAIFPMEKLFDLVIFDEASQCFTERGLPAMYRGRQLVIAGDSKQLSPFDLYKTRWDEDEEEHPDLEVDSLLDLADKYLMQVHLKGHYRSKSLDLIDFSNKHFYEGNLMMLPDRKILNRNKPAIEFIKLEGLWENNCNLIEAQYVADLVFRISKESPEKHIGVVSFNARQQDLIQDLIEEKSVEKGIFIPEKLFVKNIENVQGDERDIIIFSLTHGPDKKGKLNMQFGSMNIVNGENRLNVAITRAKEKIYVVTSFYPQEMATEHLKNEGPKLLRKYLEYAYDVSSKKYKPEMRPPNNANANWYLKNKIKQALKEDPNFKLNVSEELPFSDLNINDGKQYYGLILTDDDLYYQSVSAKETHVYNPFTLSFKNWKFRGVFSRELWQDKDEVVERLVRFSNFLEEEKSIG
jgi:hypothetical protein